MSTKKALPIDPKELIPVAAGLVIGVGIMVVLALLAKSMGLQLFVDHGLIPRQ